MPGTGEGRYGAAALSLDSALYDGTLTTDYGRDHGLGEIYSTEAAVDAAAANDNFVELEPGDVHVWHLCLDGTPSEITALEPMLLVKERAKADRLLLPRERQRFIKGRAIVRTILAAYLGTRPETLRFKLGRYGKPTLIRGSKAARIQHSVSYCGSRGVLAVGLDHPIGVDIEKIRAEFVTGELSAYLFSPGEQADLMALPKARRVEAFFKCWTAKEAYIKGVGEGFSIGLMREFDISVDSDWPPTVLRSRLDVSNGQGWSLRMLDVEDGYMAALATECAPTRIIARDAPALPASGEGAVEAMRSGSERWRVAG